MLKGQLINLFWWYKYKFSRNLEALFPILIIHCNGRYILETYMIVIIVELTSPGTGGGEAKEAASTLRVAYKSSSRPDIFGCGHVSYLSL